MSGLREQVRLAAKGLRALFSRDARAVDPRPRAMTAIPPSAEHTRCRASFTVFRFAFDPLDEPPTKTVSSIRCILPAEHVTRGEPHEAWDAGAAGPRLMELS